MGFQKTIGTGETLDVRIGYQDSDGTPNLYVQYSATNASGRAIKGREWSKELLAEYEKINAAFKKAGFDSAKDETVMYDGPILSSEGLEHPTIRTEAALEAEGAKVLQGIGFEIPMQSVVTEPRVTKGFSERVPNPAEKKPVDLKTLGTDIEDKVVAAMGASPASMKLSAELLDVVKKHLGLGQNPGGPK